MRSYLVMTIIGRDRPGLVESVARIIHDHGGNWLESRMSRLGGQFAGILRVEVLSAKEALLTEALQSLEARGLSIVISSDQPPGPSGQAAEASLEIVAQDRPGIVRQISQALALHGVNVEELLTETTSAPMSGETLFKAKARVQLPGTCDRVQLQEELEKIAADLMAEFTFRELQE